MQKTTRVQYFDEAGQDGQPLMTKNGKPYAKMTDTEGVKVSLFDPMQIETARKAHQGNAQVTVYYERNDKGYTNCKDIRPAGSPEAQAMAASKDEPFSSGTQRASVPAPDTKNRTFAMAYAKDLVCKGKVEVANMYRVAQQMLDWMEGRTEEEPPRPEEEAVDVSSIPF